MHRVFPSAHRLHRLSACLTASLALTLSPLWVVSNILAEDTEAAPETAAEHEVHTCAPGPWGNLQYYYFYLEAPDYVVAQFPMPSPVTRWVFDARTFSAVQPRLESAGLARSSLDRLFSPRRMVKDARFVYLFPTLQDLEGMSLETRSKVYAELARLPANEFHHSPIFFLTDTVNEWAEDAGLPQRIVDKMNLLAYRSGGALVFAGALVAHRRAACAAEQV